MNTPEKAALAAVLTLTTAAVGALAYAQTAEAHTPGYEANCSGVYAEIRNTPADFESTITIYVKGVDEQTSTGFGDHSLFVGDIPQNGTFYDWAVDIDSPSGRYELHTSGQVGPCGEAPTEEPTPTPTPTPTPSEPPTETPEPTPTPEEPTPTSPPSLIPPTTYTPPAPPADNPPEQTYPEPYCLGVALVTEDEDGKSYQNGHPACAGEDSREEGA